MVNSGDEQVHWQRFVRGLIVFVAGLCGMVAGANFNDTLYWFSVAILSAGFVWAMRGYLGLLFTRLAFKRKD